jgi:hypothetical protein
MNGQLNSSTPAVITRLKTKNTQFHTGIFIKHFGNSMNGTGCREGGRRVPSISLAIFRQKGEITNENLQK